METKLLYTFLTFLVFTFDSVWSLSCSKNSIFGITIRFNCPIMGMPESYAYCCGSKNLQSCCTIEGMLFGSDETITSEQTEQNLAVIVGSIITVITVAAIIIVLSCCCCSCCLLAKRRRTQGVVLTQSSQTNQVSTTVYIPHEQFQGYPKQYYPAASQADQQPMYPAAAAAAAQYPPTAPPSYQQSQQPPRYPYEDPPPYTPN